MPRLKTYVSESLTDDLLQAVSIHEELQGMARLNIAEITRGRRNVSATKNIDFTRWLDNGIDEWVMGWSGTVLHLLRRGDLSISTCIQAAFQGNFFFQFLLNESTQGLPKKPMELRPRHIKQYAAWLNRQPVKKSTAATRYKALKSIVFAMIDLGLIVGQRDEYFGATPFPRSKFDVQGEAPLAQTELRRLVSALKHDLVALHQGRFDGPPSSALMVYFLVIAIRTGGNCTPLLELARDALKPHLVPGMMSIELVKYRGANTHVTALRGGAPQREVSLSMPMDGVAVLKKVLDSTQALAAEAVPALRNRVWLYVSHQPGSRGQIKCMTQDGLNKITGQFVERHLLLGDDGQPLRLNLSRLRKNKAHELWKLSNGDLATVATALGNTPRVVGQHYLSMTSEIQVEGAKFIGEVLPDILRGNLDRTEAKRLSKMEATPVGNCKDPIDGGKAPKNGTPCDQFIHCLGCPSYAIVGSVQDLHRLFSFQAFMRAELGYFPTDEAYDGWRSHRQRLIGLIDDFTEKKFSASIVRRAKTLTQRGVHRYWEIQLNTLQRMRAGDGF